MQERLTCMNHPKVATNLRCSKCGRPICTSCIVETPVGLRCRECAQLRRIPAYAVTPQQYLVASLVTISLAFISGLGWAFVQSFPLVGFFSFFIALGVGYIMGELVTLSVNRKRGRGLQVIVATGIFLSYLISRAPFLAWFLAPSLALGGALNGLFNPIGLLVTGFAIYLAVSRMR